MINGWIILDKPLGLGSTQGVSAVKRALRDAGEPKHRVGHGGTLDPLATGVLPIALGEATKLAGRMLDATKGYEFTVAWGTATATDDAEGAVVATSDVRPDAAAIAAVLPRFTGPIVQTPPAYSALKVDGERAYKLARAGEIVELAARNVTVFALDLLSVSPQTTSLMPSEVEARTTGGACLDFARHERGLESATFSATVSKGTYIRSLARDIALALGTVGHVTMLRRTKAGPFTLAQAITLDKLGESADGAALEQALLPLTAGLDDIPALAVDPDQAAALHMGRILSGHPAAPGTYLALHGSVPVALVEVLGNEVRVLRGFNL